MKLDTWHAIGGTLAGEFAGWSDAAGIARIALRLLLALLLAAAGMGRGDGDRRHPPRPRPGHPGGALFVLALAALTGGLACFLREVYLATHAISLDPSHFERASRSDDAGRQMTLPRARAQATGKLGHAARTMIPAVPRQGA